MSPAEVKCASAHCFWGCMQIPPPEAKPVATFRTHGAGRVYCVRTAPNLTHCRTAGVLKAMLPFLCCLFASFVGHTLAAGLDDVCQANPSLSQCQSGQRASWGYEASNGPVRNYFVLLMKLTCFLSQATWAANYGAAQGGYCDGMSQSPIDLDDSVAVMNDPGEITMV